MPARSPGDKLATYRGMRSASETPEPFGGASGRAGLFVVQKHAATRLHYDFRLELGGVLVSWAVPRGPNYDPTIKRLAVQTEDHPIEYADFEGVIPEGNYGAGAVIVWDQGRWTPVEDPVEGLRKGKLVFELHGHKLRGEWTLVRTKSARSEVKGKTSNEWLLIKHRDGWAGQRETTEESIFSGLTIEELQEGTSRTDRVRAALEEAGVPRREVDPAQVRPMLAEVRDDPFDDPGWIYELKYDGFRLLASAKGKDARVFYRSGKDATAIFPDLVRALRLQPFESFLLDGEVVVLDAASRPVFNLLQQRTQLTRRSEIEQAAVQLPAILYCFDLLAFEDFDLRDLPLVRRKELLRMVLPGAGPLRYADHIEGRGVAFFREVERMGLEGMVAKRADAPYRSGRSSAWQKVRVERTGDFVIVGFTAPTGSRTGFGALHVGVFEQGTLRYAGRVGTGFDEAKLRTLYEALAPLRRPDPAAAGALPKGSKHTWVEPRLVCEVRYKERTPDGLLRHPSFLRLRDDKEPEECLWPDEAREAPVPVEEPPDPGPAAAGEGERVVHFTNLDKVFWPEEGFTKGDLIDFYREVSPFLLPYLEDRPLVLTRYPDGIHGKSFFQKDAPEWVPSWLRTERMWSEHAEREIDYFVCDDVDALVFLVNLGTIPLHVWSSRIRNLSRPDWCILDLDPKGAPFTDVVRIALAIRELCDSIGLPTFVKTSGSTGLHVLVPLGAQVTYEQSRGLGELLARVICHRLPDIATTIRQVGRRGGRVYIDYVQNGHGRLLVSPFCVRPLPGAPVSMTLDWSEVHEGLRLSDFTIRNAVEILSRRGDPMRPVLEVAPDLGRALERLARVLG